MAVLLQFSRCGSLEETTSRSVWIGIAAGVVGAAILLCMLAGVAAVLGFLWRKRNRRGRRIEGMLIVPSGDIFIDVVCSE